MPRWAPNKDAVPIPFYDGMIDCQPAHGLLNRWTSQLDLGITTGGLERVVSVHNST